MPMSAIWSAVCAGSPPAVSAAELGVGFVVRGESVSALPSAITFKLRAFIVVDLSMTAFEPEFAGKINFYSPQPSTTLFASSRTTGQVSADAQGSSSECVKFCEGSISY